MRGRRRTNHSRRGVGGNVSRISGLIEAVKARIEREGANINNVTASLAALDSTVAPECCKRIYLKHIANQTSAEAE